VVRVNNYLKDKASKLLLTVHDELMIDWNLNDGDIVTPICKLMTSFGKMFKVPIEVEPAICSHSWQDKREFGIPELLETAFLDYDTGDRRWAL
jgi:DNA polymerase I-like protein with 3'-5' exonuclease and polymerase domains